MPDDIRFVNFRFAAANAGPSPALRTMPERLSDVFNVKDFGATPSHTGSAGAHNDQPAIQAAVNAALSAHGGTIYFPPGVYNVGSRITVPGSPAYALSFISGGGDVTTTGTMLSASMADYILYVGHGSGTPVKTIQGLAFANGLDNVDITSTEPRPGGNGMGCIYLGSGIAPSIMFCSIGMDSGIGIFSAAKNLFVSSTQLGGNYNLSQPDNRTFGLILADGGKLVATKVQGCAHGLVCIGDPSVAPFVGGSCTAEMIDFERNLHPVRLGHSPIAWWNPNAGAIKAAGAAPMTGGMFNTCHQESPGVVAYELDNVSNVTFQSCRTDSFNQLNGDLPFCQNGYLLKAVRNCTFLNCTATNSYITAACNLNGGGAVEGNLFEQCDFATTGPGTAFINKTSYAAGALPNIFRSCNVPGGLMLAQLPPSPPTPCGPVVCTNSDLPAWNLGAATSNVGRPITAVGAANNIVIARWNGAAWTIAAG